MNGPDETRRELKAARALTSARYGIITTVDETGEVRDFVSSGFTPEEKQQFAEWPDGPRLFAHLRGCERRGRRAAPERVAPPARVRLAGSGANESMG